jgi:hypothetical protein
MVLLVMTMRVVAARTSSIARRRDRPTDRRLSPIAAQRSTSARLGVQVACVGVTFFVAYVTLQLLHAFGRDPAIVAALVPIPLFARFVASAICALPIGLAVGVLLRDRERWLSTLPTLLAIAIGLFVLTVAFCS